MKITKQKLKQLIKEELDLYAEPGISVEDKYVQLIRNLGARTVVRAIISVLSQKGIDDQEHYDVLDVLEEI